MKTHPDSVFHHFKSRGAWRNVAKTSERLMALMLWLIALTVSANARAATISALSLQPTTVVGGQTSLATVTLASAGDTTTVTLTSDAPQVAIVPATVTIPSGLTSMTFVVATHSVSANTTVHLSATAGGAPTTVALQITPAASSTGASAVVDDPGCRANTLPRNDDGSTPAVNLPSPVNFFGTTYTFFYINNNGNVTFRVPMQTYTPFSITASVPPIIAPFFADVDTRGSGSSPVTYSFGPITFSGRPTVCVDWVNVGYFNAHYDKLNSFQLLLVDRSDVSPGDFDIVMNYNRIAWETGDASSGINGFGGTSAGAGYSAGTGVASQFYQFPGSLVNGALLDGNANTGLTQTSRNSLVLGRHIFEVRNGTAPAGGGIGGVVSDSNGQPLAGAPVQACRVSDAHCVYVTQTSTQGRYEATGLPAGDYSLAVFPPAGTALSTATVAPIHVVAGMEQVVNVTLTGPTPLPPTVTLSPSRASFAGPPVTNWHDPLSLSVANCTGGSSSYTMTGADGSSFASGALTEQSAGTFTAVIPPVYPHHGPARIVITTHCPDGTTSTIAFDVYVDPSGVVRTVQGLPIPGALVTLYRSDSAAGPFLPVPAGSAVMSPMNRNDPDLTDANGHFGWDVITGFYKVRAQAAGCTSPTGGAFVESDVLGIPPAISDLDLRLNCAAPPPSCALTNVIAGPPKQLQIVVQSSVGLASVEVTTATNASVEVPQFATGTTSAEMVVATKIDQSGGSQVALSVTDILGQVTDCDPVVPGEAPAITNTVPETGAGCNIGSRGGRGGLPAVLALLTGLALLRRRRSTAH
ncbi:MAG: nidogen-like domain-containing protein [Pseudomonadota bacterium]